MNKSGKNTLLWSVIMSSPGPLIVGLGLIIGQSTTQIADFIRRTIELLAIILSFVIYSITNKTDNFNQLKKEKLEKGSNIFVSFAMIICGIIMALIAIFLPTKDKGNVIPGLAIAILGVIANAIFWFRYQVLSKKTKNAILKVQSNLYRAKTFVDSSVVISLFVVLFSTNQQIIYYFDLIGTLCVSLYLFYSGCATLFKELNIKNYKH